MYTTLRDVLLLLLLLLLLLVAAVEGQSRGGRGAAGVAPGKAALLDE
jgi:hypothetical protein